MKISDIVKSLSEDDAAMHISNLFDKDADYNLMVASHMVLYGSSLKDAEFQVNYCRAMIDQMNMDTEMRANLPLQ